MYLNSKCSKKNSYVITKTKYIVSSFWFENKQINLHLDFMVQSQTNQTTLIILSYELKQIDLF